MMSMRIQQESSHPTTLALLGFVKDEPRHGYAIYRELSEANGIWLVWRMKQSQLYALLSKLEEQGYLSSFKQEAHSGRPPRKMYSLTKAGKDAFDNWLTSPVGRGRQFRLDLLVKLFFAQQAGEAALSHLLQIQQKACEQWLTETNTLEQEQDETYTRLVYRYRTGQIKAMLDWLRECRETLTAPTITK